MPLSFGAARLVYEVDSGASFDHCVEWYSVHTRIATKNLGLVILFIL